VKIDQYLAKMWTKCNTLLFLPHPVDCDAAATVTASAAADDDNVIDDNDDNQVLA